MKSLFAFVFTLLQLLCVVTAHSAYLTQPVNWTTYSAPNPAPVKIDSDKEIFQIDVYRAWPLEEAYLYKTYMNFLGGDYFEIPMEDLTCGEYSIVVTTTDNLLAVAGLFYVQNDRFLVKFMYPDMASVSAPREGVLIKWKVYRGYSLGPVSEDVSICIAPPKMNEECGLGMPMIERFGDEQAIWYVPNQVIRGYYQITAEMIGQLGNRESTYVYIDPSGINKPELTLKKELDEEDKYTLQIGSGSPYNWLFQFSINNINWFEFSGEFIRPNSTLTIRAPGAETFFVKLRLH